MFLILSVVLRPAVVLDGQRFSNGTRPDLHCRMRCRYTAPATVRARANQVADAAQGRHDGVPVAAQYFGGAGQHYAERHGTARETFAAIAVKAHARSPAGTSGSSASRTDDR